jgi:two-component system repressor protein LuxO
MLTGRRILLIEDNDRLAELYTEQLKASGAEVARRATGMDGLAAAKGAPPSLILLDIELPDIDGFEVLDRLSRMGSDAAVVVITAHGSVNYAVDAMRRGAADFLVKPFDGPRLLVTVANALERHDLAAVVETVSRPMAEGFHDFVGGSAAMQAVYRTLAAAAASRASVFITGESGTGKELCAHALHRQGPRKDAPFIALNCGAIPRELMEAEIFGHRRGAFTGATTDRTGAAELADGGTLFLDEIGEMDVDLQTKLLRFVQTGTFTRVGEGAERTVDVRFVCATNRDPAEAIRAGALREDLFYRLNVIPIRMPPLRDRAEDIQPIADHFLRRFAVEEGKGFTGFDGDAIRLLRDYPWPGNVRELENVIRGTVVLNIGTTITGAMIQAALGACGPIANAPAVPSPSPSPRPEGEVRPLAIVEREAIEGAISSFDGNIPKAAAALGVAPSTIYRKVQSWGGARP